MESDIKLSIVVTVYNHERYVTQAIKSILMQKVNFKYEVLIGEDCSKDSSRAILKKMENNLHDGFKFFFREHNYGAESNFRDLYSRMMGKYFIVLEGDDFWIDENKIQRQVDFLDEHPDYISCAHNVAIVDENSNAQEFSYPECKDSEYTLNHYRKGILPGQTASHMIRNYYRYNLFDYSIEAVPFAGDRRKAFLVASYGKVYCFQEKWSAYRYITNSGTSFSATHLANKSSRSEEVFFYKRLCEYSKNITKRKKCIVISEQMYFKSLISDVISKDSNYNWKYVLEEFETSKFKVNIISYIIFSMVKHLF